MDRFFEFAHERHSIYLRRTAGEPWPWSHDEILNRYRFTNVYRELDATTQWFRQYVRDPLRSRPEVLLATVLFRWFNRTTTGEAIFRQTVGGEDGSVRTPWEHILVDRERGLESAAWSIKRFCGKGPYVTGAYVIRSPEGHDKLAGILVAFDWFMQDSYRSWWDQSINVGWREVAEKLLAEPGEHRLEHVWKWITNFRILGDFMAYEIVTDLRHTDLLHLAPDIMTWANPGPGARRGLDRLHERYKTNARTAKLQYILEMRNLLDAAREGAWPNTKEYPPLEMRDIEHTLCEFDKYERVRLGEGAPRGVFRG